MGAVDPDQIKDDILRATASESSAAADAEGKIQLSDMFVTLCFFARLGFIQPPSCLKCAYRSSGCGDANKKVRKNTSEEPGGSGSATPFCSELVPWRIDAGIPLHPDKLDGNIVFVTCDTAKSLVNGDAYPSIRWDTRNKRLLHEI